MPRSSYARGAEGTTGSHDEEEDVLRFSALGEFRVVDQDRECTPSAPTLRRVLAALVLQANEVIPAGALIEELWGAEPPSSALTTLQTYVYQLRRLLNLTARGGSQELVTRAPGYVLVLEPGASDVHQFEELLRQGRIRLEEGDGREASAKLAEALALWRGPALADLEPGPLLQVHVARLEERRIAALQLRIEVDQALGRHRELIGELKSLINEHRLNEWLYAQLMLALYRAGRRSEALEVYHHVRHVLRNEYGLEPSSDLQRLQREVLVGSAPQGGLGASSP
jgi:SARP family transcriptional regulator, regulator of embCAB operon